MKLTALFLLFFIAFQTKAQSGNVPVLTNYITNYSENDYGAFNAQNWSVCQDSNGLMYFGNSFNVLTFDGTHWNSIAIEGQANYVVSLLAAEDGNIYWGSTGDLGVIKTDKRGQKTSYSLRNKLPELDRYFSQVWRTMQYGNKIAFFTQESIFLYLPDKDTFDIIYPKESFHLAFVVDNKLYARDRAFGLEKFDGEKFSPIDGGEVFHNEGVFGMFSLEDGKILIITQQIGLFVYNPKAKGKKIFPLNSANSDFLNQQQIIGGIPLKDGNIALNTGSNGVIIMDVNGRVIQRINISSGISDNDVKQIYQDKYENLWLATNNGISCINYASNISFYLHDERTGLYGSVNALARTPEDLFVGTTTGLFVYHPGSNTAFEQISGLYGNIAALTSVNNELFIGTADALYLLNKDGIRKLASMDVRVLKYSLQKNVLYALGSNGLFIFNEKSAWTSFTERKDIVLDAIGLELITDSESEDYLWVGTMSQGLWKIKVDRDFNTGTEVFQDVDGDPGSWVIPFLIDNKVVAGTRSGLWRLVSREEILQQMSDTADAKDITPYFLPADIPSLDSGIVSSITQKGTKYWLVYNGIVGEYEKNKLYQTPYLSLDVGKINTLLAGKDSVLWIGSNGGLTRVDFAKKEDFTIQPDITINTLSFSKDSILFYFPEKGKTYSIDYSLNSFTISFSSLYNENGKKALYSYKLEGYDEDWSPWSSEPQAVYKKVYEGNYSFKVRAKNVYQVVSPVKVLSLSIASPWYRKWWAYLSYLVIFAMIMVGFVKAYTYRLKQKNIQLEAIIVDRTKEIVKQKDEIEKQRDLIKEVHEEIQSSITYAKRIQTAVLPENEFEHPFIKDFFILFRPKDIVSGDFYWAKKSGDYLVMAVADCTGHGVPGAFMSMLGISLLNEIVGKNQTTEAAKILNELRQGVVKSLKQKGESDDQKDGMDISLVSLNLMTGELQWAGAHNPLFILSKEKPAFQETTSYKEFDSEISDTKLFELKPNKMPIAISQRMNNFTNHRFMLHPGDRFYMFSDGYIDQFGGPKGKKFMIRAFRNMILNISDKPMPEQKETLNSRLEEWIAHLEPDTQLPHHQIDDVCVMGVKV